MTSPIYSIYKITNKINQKVYIGQTTAKIEKRLSAHRCKSNKHKSAITNSILKHGWDNFEVEVIETCSTIEELNRKEIHWIIFYDSMNPDRGYNLRSGGENKFCSEETKKKLRSVKRSPQQKIKYSLCKLGKLNPSFGKPCSNRKSIICTETQEKFDSISDASNKMNIDIRLISNVLNKKRKHTHGFTFSFL